MLVLALFVVSQIELSSLLFCCSKSNSTSVDWLYLLHDSLREKATTECLQVAVAPGFKTNLLFYCRKFRLLCAAVNSELTNSVQTVIYFLVNAGEQEKVALIIEYGCNFLTAAY